MSDPKEAQDDDGDGGGGAHDGRGVAGAAVRPRERGAELIGGVIVIDNPLRKHQLVCSEIPLKLGAAFGE